MLFFGLTGELSNTADVVLGLTGELSNTADVVLGLTGGLSNTADVVLGLTGGLSNTADVVLGLTGGLSNTADVVFGLTGGLSNTADVVLGLTGGLSNTADVVFGLTGELSNTAERRPGCGLIAVAAVIIPLWTGMSICIPGLQFICKFPNCHCCDGGSVSVDPQASKVVCCSYSLCSNSRVTRDTLQALEACSSCTWSLNVH